MVTRLAGARGEQFSSTWLRSRSDGIESPKPPSERESQSNLSRAMMIPFSLPFLFLFPLLANAYTWQFTSQPRQCQNLSLAVQGSGQPPYSLLIIPTGPTPIPNNTEVRLIQNIPFSGSSTTLSFKLDYPENSSFVAVVRSYFTHSIFLLICSYCATLFTGQRQEWFWLRWRQHFGHRSPIVRLELLQCLSSLASRLVFQHRSYWRAHSMSIGSVVVGTAICQWVRRFINLPSFSAP
jgi:hypothetical protein